MKSVIISIRPEWCEKILNGEKTIEVRKSAPKELPIKVYIYETKGSSKKGRGKVIGEFICDKVDFVAPWGIEDIPLFYSDKWVKEILKKACLTCDEAIAYQGNKSDIYAWHITALKIYDKPRELAEFYSIKQCKPEYSPFGYQWTWEDRHKRNPGGCENEYRPVPIECHRCKSLVGGKDYLDEKSGCILFDYECVSKYHKPIARPPQSWQYIEEDK